ncbi:MAG: glycosyltransferase family 4 protein [Candidatus Omnitrophota bacterium]
MKKIKVVRIIARLNIGGPAIHTILLSAGLNERLFETILVSGTPDEHEGDMQYLAREKGLTPQLIPELGRSVNIGNDWVAFKKLYALIKKEKPDIIHTHTAKAGTLGRLAGILYNLSSRHRCLLIHTFHGHVLQGYFSRWQTGGFIWIERILALFTPVIIAVSASVKKDLLTLRIGTAQKIAVIALGLELERYLAIDKNTKLKRPGGAFTIGIVGRLVPIKNHQLFLDVAKKLKDTVEPGKKLQFLVVGDGHLRAELTSYAKKLGIEKEVTFTGWVQDLSSIYRDLDIATLTSLNEGTPVALIEAQAAACPCVATNVGGTAEVVENQKSGFLVASQDREGFTQSLQFLLRNPELISIMGNYGRQRVKEKFSQEKLIANIEALYTQELKKRGVT